MIGSAPTFLSLWAMGLNQSAAVAVRPVVAEPRRVCVVGAGPAALAFVREYRAHNRDDRIQVLSAERELFYNRVLLVEYLAGKRHWAELCS